MPLNVCSACEDALISSNAFRLKCYRSLATLHSIKERIAKEEAEIEADATYDSDDNALLVRLLYFIDIVQATY